MSAVRRFSGLIEYFCLFARFFVFWVLLMLTFYGVGWFITLIQDQFYASSENEAAQYAHAEPEKW